jgi:RNA polymerase sigma-70 factor (ECF subfamily)
VKKNRHIPMLAGVPASVGGDTERVLGLPAVASGFDFEIVFREQYPRIARVLARLVRDPARAEDLAVETLLKLYRTPKAQGPEAAGWLYRTAVRAGLDELRKRGRREKYERMAPGGRPSPSPEQIYAETERQVRVRETLANLKVRQAELLLLRSSGLSYREVADTLGLNPASVGTLLWRAEEAFRKEYVKRYGSQE